MNKNIYTRIILIGIIFALLPQVIAFAVSSKYYDGYPLYMQPGETTETFFTLQNIAGTQNITLKAKIEEGENIITLLDESDTYNVTIGGKVRVNFRINAPSDSKIGDKLPITIFFTQISTQEKGSVAIGGSIGKGFDVLIGQPSDFVPKEKPETNRSYYIIALIIILIIIIFFVVKKSKNRLIN